MIEHRVDLWWNEESKHTRGEDARSPRGTEVAAGCSPLLEKPPRTANRQASRAEPLAGVGSFMMVARIAMKSFGG